MLSEIKAFVSESRMFSEQKSEVRGQRSDNSSTHSRVSPYVWTSSEMTIDVKEAIIQQIKYKIKIKSIRIKNKIQYDKTVI